MKLDRDTSLESFRDEMQHRVVKYPLRSRPVKEAIRFAKRNDDAAFHRIATDKIHAQKQFQRELNGPSKFERCVDFLTLGSLREVFVMLLLVVAGIAGVEAVKSAYVTINPPEPNVDLEEFAKRLNLGINLERPEHGAQDQSELRQSELTQRESILIDALSRKIAAILVKQDLVGELKPISDPSNETSSDKKDENKSSLDVNQLVVATNAVKEKNEAEIVGLPQTTGLESPDE